jgi:hypothetical protein
MRAVIISSALGAVVLAGIAPLASAAPMTVTFQNNTAAPFGGNYYGTQDNILYPDGTPGDGTSDTNAGLFTALMTNGAMTDATRNRSIIKFDLSSLAAQGAVQVQSATLTLVETNPQTDQFKVNLYRIADANAAWEQGSGLTFGATKEDSTWNYLHYNDVTWAGGAAGAGLSLPTTDYDPNYVAQFNYNDSTDIVQNPTGTAVVNITLPAYLVQYWVDHPSDNAGLLMALDSNTLHYAQFQSSDYGTVSNHPALEVTYSVPEPMTGSLLLIGAGLMALRRRRR